MINKENYLRNIPMELREYKQWLWFKKIRKQDLKGKEKMLKLPVSPITGIIKTNGQILKRQLII